MHAAINDIVLRAFSSAQVPSRLEPLGLDRSDGKRPDGVTIVPWKNSKHLVWDATYPDTYAPSYISSASNEAGAVAAAAESRKLSKYSYLDPAHFFVPVAVETAGVFGPLSRAFMQDLGDRLNKVSGDARSRLFLFQRVSVTIQRGNAASVLGTIAPSASLEDVFIV